MHMDQKLQQCVEEWEKTLRHADMHRHEDWFWCGKTLHNDTKKKVINWGQLEPRVKKVIELVEKQATEQELRVQKDIELMKNKLQGRNMQQLWKDIH